MEFSVAESNANVIGFYEGNSSLAVLDKIRRFNGPVFVHKHQLKPHKEIFYFSPSFGNLDF